MGEEYSGFVKPLFSKSMSLSIEPKSSGVWEVRRLGKKSRNLAGGQCDILFYKESVVLHILVAGKYILVIFCDLDI